MLILGRNIYFGRLFQTLAVGLVIFGVTFLVACSDDQDTQAVEGPQPTATSAVASADAQLTREAPSPTTVPAVADSATASPPDTIAARESATPSGPPVQVVTTANFVADWARVVGGERVEVFGLLPPGGDPHTFVPAARDVAKVVDADVVFTVGLGLEADWLDDLLHNASADESKIVALGDSVDPIEFAMVDTHDDHEDEGDDGHGEMIVGRLLVGDGERGTVSVIDLETGEVALLNEHELGEQGDGYVPVWMNVGPQHGAAVLLEGDLFATTITDSVGGNVLQLDERELEVVRRWDVAGAPTKIAFVGIVGEPEGHNDHSDDHGHTGHEGHDHGSLDPHFWFDPIRVKVAVNEIAVQLSILDPENAATYFLNASDYGERLDELHSWIQERVDIVQPERRLLVTSHDSLSYLARAYGFEVVGLVIPSLATHVEPSAEHIAEVVEVVRERNVPAVFGETTVSERLAQTVARETGAELVQLYSGSLGEEGSGADTYIGMLRTNVERIVEALK